MSKKSTSSKDWREGRRMRAWELHEQGWKQKDIAAALRVSEGAVSQWFKKAKTQGVEALRHQLALGATPKSLSGDHRLFGSRGSQTHPSGICSSGSSSRMFVVLT